jgi:glutathione-regulated potassium-efflux system ancillary protein KefC
MRAILNRAGHGELLVLLGLLIPMVGVGLFQAVGLKPDLGALILGILLAGSDKANELSNSLLSFKDLFLVGFFLTIGLSGTPSWNGLGVAALLTLIVPFKIGFFIIHITKFKVRARASTITSLSLANYSEFGLIIGATSVASGWISTDWMINLALAMSISFILASPLNRASQAIYARFHERLKQLESEARLPEDEFIDPGDAEIIVFGMGRIGTHTYDGLFNRYGQVVLGIDSDPAVVSRHNEQGRKVLLGDAADFDFWNRVRPFSKVRLVVLAMLDHKANLYSAQSLSASTFNGTVAATTRHEDQQAELLALGVDTVFNLYEEAGAGLAQHVSQIENWQNSSN